MEQQTCKNMSRNQQWKPYPSDATGFRLTFSFSPTGVGNIIKASCACGASKDCYDPYSIENF